MSREKHIVAVEARTEIDHPIGHDGLPIFTSSEIGLLRSRYPQTPDARTAAYIDHRKIEEGSTGVLLHFPHRYHPCGICRSEMDPLYEFVPATEKEK